MLHLWYVSKQISSYRPVQYYFVSSLNGQPSGQRSFRLSVYPDFLCKWTNWKRSLFYLFLVFYIKKNVFVAWKNVSTQKICTYYILYVNRGYFLTLCVFWSLKGTRDSEKSGTVQDVERIKLKTKNLRLWLKILLWFDINDLFGSGE